MRAKRAWVISDIHFGYSSNSQYWLDSMNAYFENFLIPLLKKEYREGDIFLCLGDVFDNRSSIQIPVHKSAYNTFERICRIFPETHIIAGNHDVFNRTDNELCSLDMLHGITNLYIHKKPYILNTSAMDCLLMPWCATPQEELDVLKNNIVDGYVFCHTDIVGMKFNKHSDVEHGNTLSDFLSMYRKVYSGHIHYRQDYGTHVYVGSAIAMSRSDIGNSKGVYLIDFDSDSHTFIENTYSPNFIQVNYSDMKGLNESQIEKVVGNNIVDVAIEGTVGKDEKAFMEKCAKKASVVRPVFAKKQEASASPAPKGEKAVYSGISIENVVSNAVHEKEGNASEKEKVHAYLKSIIPKK